MLTRRARGGVSATVPHAAEHDRNGGLIRETTYDGLLAEVCRGRASRANEFGRDHWYADAAGGHVHEIAVEVAETWTRMLFGAGCCAKRCHLSLDGGELLGEGLKDVR